MDLHERQQFDFMLFTAVERYVERLEQRNEGGANALAGLQSAPQGEGIWLNDFTDAIFSDFILDNVEGACFVLKALAKRALPSDGRANVGRIDAHLIALAKASFAELLRQKTIESLEQRISYQAVDTGGHE